MSDFENSTSRAMNLSMTEEQALKECRAAGVGVSAIETLKSGGVRLVCMSSHGAAQARRTFKSKLIAGDVVREAFRPSRPMW